jgi:glutamate dehydrogenase
MTDRVSGAQQITDEVLELLRSRMADVRVAVLSEFITHYLDGVSEQDLCEFRTADLYGACVSRWHFLQLRCAGESRVRVYNPQFDTHGWESSHSVIEIVCDDMPFLVDAVRMAMERRGVTVHLLIHPVLHVVRDEQGQARAVSASANREPAGSGCLTEALLHFEVDRQNGQESLLAIEKEVRAVLADVTHAVADWECMRERLQQAIERLHGIPPQSQPATLGLPLLREQFSEALAFLRWVDNDHFTFLGYESLQLEHDGDDLKLRISADSGLGVLRGYSKSPLEFAQLTPELRRLALEPAPLVLSKSNTRSTVHRQCIGRVIWTTSA